MKPYRIKYKASGCVKMYTSSSIYKNFNFEKYDLIIYGF